MSPTGSCFELDCKIFRAERVLIQHTHIVQRELVRATISPTECKDHNFPRPAETHRAIQFSFLIHSKVKSTVDSSDTDQAHCYTDKFQYTYEMKEKTNNVCIVSIERFFFFSSYDLSLNVKQLFSRLFSHFLSCLEENRETKLTYNPSLWVFVRMMHRRQH